MLRQIESEPHQFSANVLLRPVVQDYLLPTLAYVGGAAEIAYFGQGAVVYKALLGRATPILPRFSATLVEAKPQTLLERYGLTVPDVFHAPEELREKLAKHTLPPDLQSAFDQADSSLKNPWRRFSNPWSVWTRLWWKRPSMPASKMQHQLEQLRSRAARAELRQSEVLGRHAEFLSNALYPNKAPAGARDWRSTTSSRDTEPSCCAASTTRSIPIAWIIRSFPCNPHRKQGISGVQANLADAADFGLRKG